MRFNEETDFLAHYGVKGMRWGVKHDRAPKTNKNLTERLEEYRYNKAKKKTDKLKAASKKSWEKYKELYRKHPAMVAATTGLGVATTIGLIVYNDAYDRIFRGFFNTATKDLIK